MLITIAPKDIVDERELLIAKFNDARVKFELNEGEEDAQALLDVFREIDQATSVYELQENVSTLGYCLFLYDQKKIFDSLPIDMLETLMPKNWKQGGPSELDEEELRSYMFKKFCQSHRKKALKTIYGYIRIGEVFLSGDITLDYPSGLNPDWWSINPSNLLIAAGRAAKGNLSDESWKLLADPNTSQDALIESIHAGDETPSDTKDVDKPFFSVQDGVLYYLYRPTGEMVGFAAYDDSEEEAVVTAIEAFEDFMLEKGFSVK